MATELNDESQTNEATAAATSPESSVTKESKSDADNQVPSTAVNSSQVQIETLKVYKPGELAPAESIYTHNANAAVKLRMGTSGTAAYPPETLPTLFARIAKNYSNAKALADKRNGEWKFWTYEQYYRDCKIAAKSFLKLGLERYHGVGIMGFNAPEWFIASFGAMFAGGLGVGIYTTNSPEACHYVASNCEANIIVVENQAQLSKILQIWDKMPHLKAVIQYKGELQERKENIYTWAEFMELGKDISDDVVDAIINSQAPNQCCTLIYTSGTTGNPKGVMISHDNYVWTSKVSFKTVALAMASHSGVSYLPLSHVAAQLMDIYIPLVGAGCTYFARPDALKGTLVDTLKEVRPTALLGVPRVWEKIMERMRSVSQNVTGFKKRIAIWAKGIGYRGNINIMNGSPPPWGWTAANFLLFRKVRQTLGLDRCLHCFSGAAPLSQETVEYFLGVNIPIYDLYGMSESSAPHSLSMPGNFRLGSVGKVIEGAKTKISDPDENGNGEVCFYGRHVFMGYLNMEAKTKEVIDYEGYLHSGDIGMEDKDGFLYITGRIKELIITAGGENVAPVPIEDVVKKEAQVIGNCMLIGDQKKFLSLLVTLKVKIDETTLEPSSELSVEALNVCKTIGSGSKTVAEAIADEKIKSYIQTAIDTYNNKHATSRAQRIQKYIFIEKDFSVPGGELGPTLKLKRPVVLKMYANEIEKIYEDAQTPGN
ncbi:long-chain-fatty-acid--CoA ligase ACSBG2-like [Anneissia japonica]|uniref:long-chain-fatty-acid--CoA ligase ACSBG2-like n=1 Tax=Anneissia japonica TaxID=1529436 RepID=UPI00142587B5|nr:long-chain-fatty-acid--CoA ligase ACSBG2-like [Anneissia japonica]